MTTAFITADDRRTRGRVLRSALGDRVTLAGDAAYDTARLAWNRAADQHPFAVATPRTEADVVDAMRAARACGLRVVPQSTGHGAGALDGADLAQALLVRLDGMRSVTVDAHTRSATVAAGARWHDVLAASAPFGLTGLHGSAGDISVVGYTLGGGLSFYGRRHGLAANTVRAARIVMADGEIHTVAADDDADLFWALRGASGAFGIVVALEIELLAYAEIFAGMLLWGAEHAGIVARTWARWAVRAPESATTSLRIMHFPPIPQLPPFIRGRSVVVVDGVILEEDAAAHAVLAPLRALDPELDTFARMPAAQLTQVHMDPPEPSPAVSAHVMLDALTADAADRLVAASMRERPMISEVRHLGGAIARCPDGGGAVSALDAPFALWVADVLPDPTHAAAATARTRAVVDGMRDWHSSARLAPTFVDEPGVDPRRTFGAAHARLAQLKRRHDPDDMLVGFHSVG